jgi:hypothetical protein
LSVAPVISLFNADHIPDFHREWIAERLVEPEGFHPHILRAPRHYSVQAFPARVKERLARKYEDHIRSLGPSAAANAFRGVLNFMAESDLSGELENFRKTTSELDRIRGDKLLDVFPELAELYPPAAASSARSS